MQAVDRLDQVLRWFPTADVADLRSGDKYLGYLSGRDTRLACSIDRRFHCGMKCVRAGHEFHGHVSDDVPLFAEIARQTLRIDFAAAEDREKAARRFKHVFVDRVTATGSEGCVDGAQSCIPRVILACP